MNTEPLVILQAGHQNIQQNSIVKLRGSTGAPGEQAFTVSLAIDLAAELRQYGINAQTVDANRHAIYDQTAALFLALHTTAMPNRNLADAGLLAGTLTAPAHSPIRW